VISPLPRSHYARRFAQALAMERRKAGLTQEALAEQAGVSVRYIQRIESGGRLPDLPIADALRKALRLDWDDLLPK
jgi:transcriptional regulator with XRE-family HTH domain